MHASCFPLISGCPVPSKKPIDKSHIQDYAEDKKSNIITAPDYGKEDFYENYYHQP